MNLPGQDSALDEWEDATSENLLSESPGLGLGNAGPAGRWKRRAWLRGFGAPNRRQFA